MNKFLKFNMLDGGTVYVRPEDVSCFGTVKLTETGGKTSWQTMVGSKGANQILVKESIDEIEAMFEGAV